MCGILKANSIQTVMKKTKLLNVFHVYVLEMKRMIKILVN